MKKPIWTGLNCNTTASMRNEGKWRVHKGPNNPHTKWYDNTYSLPKWIQKDIVLLKWMPEGAWCSLGMWQKQDDVGAHMERVTAYYLFSPVLRKKLLKLEKENQNEQ